MAINGARPPDDHGGLIRGRSPRVCCTQEGLQRPPALAHVEDASAHPVIDHVGLVQRYSFDSLCQLAPSRSNRPRRGTHPPRGNKGLSDVIACRVYYWRMKIEATASRGGKPNSTTEPTLLLHADRWDDYGFKTSYFADLWLPGRADSISLGAVKFMTVTLERSSHTISLPKDIGQLDDSFASLGQSLSYYERLLANLDHKDVFALLLRLQDITVLPGKMPQFREVEAFETSLLREGGARRALKDAPRLLTGGDLSSGLTFDFVTNLGGEDFTTNFDFRKDEYLPSRINAVIGYNGAGKTSLLGRLARVAWQDRRQESAVSTDGDILPTGTAFGRVIAISYSAFDTFETPSKAASRDGVNLSNSDTTSHRNYVYCGLRDVTSRRESDRLKSMAEVAEELERSLSAVAAAHRWDALDRALAPLLREPSFQLSSTSIDFRDSPDEWRIVFDQLSTGHKISLNIVVQLVANLVNESLVLIDEPESHLHPPLLAALMKGISEALTERNSFAIIATHSPVVLQEIAARHVRILRRYGTRTEVENPEQETFGENVGTLTRRVFNLNNAESDFEGVLKNITLDLGQKGLTTVFPMGPSAQALSLAMQFSIELDQEGTEHP